MEELPVDDVEVIHDDADVEDVNVKSVLAPEWNLKNCGDEVLGQEVDNVDVDDVLVDVVEVDEGAVEELLELSAACPSFAPRQLSRTGYACWAHTARFWHEFQANGKHL